MTDPRKSIKPNSDQLTAFYMESLEGLPHLNEAMFTRAGREATVRRFYSLLLFCSNVEEHGSAAEQHVGSSVLPAELCSVGLYLRMEDQSDQFGHYVKDVYGL